MIRQLLFGGYALLVAALLAGVAYIHNLRCESFGCIGVGVAWAAWSAVFAVALVLGLSLAGGSHGPRHLHRWARWLLIVQSLAGVVVLALWAFGS